MMTVDEVNELMRNGEVRFTYYYKYTFSFAIEIGEHWRVETSLGGNMHDVYRLEIEPVMAFKSVDEWKSVNIYKDGVEVFRNEKFEW